MNTRNLTIAFFAIAILLLILFPNHPRTVKHTVTRTVRVTQDSAKVLITHKPEAISFKAKLQQRRELLTLDTIVDRDTLRLEIAPDSSIVIQLLPASRVIEAWVRYQRADSIIYERELVTELMARPWYESPLLVLIGAVLGFLLAIVL